MRVASRKPEWQKAIAWERMEILFSLAEKEFAVHPQRSNRYVELATRIAKRYNIKMKERKGGFCRKCFHYLKPGVNCRVRTSAEQRAVIMTCGDCGHVMRFPYRREKAARK